MSYVLRFKNVHEINKMHELYDLGYVVIKSHFLLYCPYNVRVSILLHMALQNPEFFWCTNNDKLKWSVFKFYNLSRNKRRQDGLFNLYLL